MSTSAANEVLQQQPLVRIIDDDSEVRAVLVDLLRSVDLEAVGYASADEYEQRDNPEVRGCLVLDINLSGTSGLDLHDNLRERGNLRPVIFITGEGTVTGSVRALKGGALDFLVKPFEDQEFVDAVEIAIEKDRVSTEKRIRQRDVEALGETLTAREREVMAEILRGMMNKQIAAAFGISEVTVKLHRKNLMRKLHASSFADLIRKAELLKGEQS